VSAVYVDTSALGRLLLDEPQRRSIEHVLETFDDRVSSRLLRVELRRLALREGTDADEALARIVLLPLDAAILSAAETIEPAGVAALDAIHLATAVRLAADGELDAMLTYDLRLADGARHHGLRVVAPGA
jgi:predicted nucleic acid-binding protein